MLQNLFTTSPLVWGGLIAGLAALPVLIHLINMLRHKRVQWAAMDFLLQSYKRQRNWIWLKQLLLLLARMAVLLLALFTLANAGCNSEYARRLLGGRTTHHYVLLDDSFSMSDRVAGATVFDRARKTVQTIAARAGNEQNQRLTLLRFSQAALHAGDQKAASQPVEATAAELDEQFSQVADINGAQIDSSFKETLEERRNQIEVSQLATGPLPALATVLQLIEQRGGEDAEIHIVSDFRAKDWEQSNELIEEINQISKTSKVHFIRCVENERPNLAIMELSAVKNTRAAGVPLFCEVQVKNFGTTAATKVSVNVATLVYDEKDLDAIDPATLEAKLTELPTVFFESIGPGETARQQFSVFFSEPGKHVVQAALPEDAIAADNVRRQVIEVVDAAKVLLIDDERRLHSYYLASAFEPSNAGRTGIVSDTQTVDFFRSVETDDLQKYAAIYLLDVARLDEGAIRKIKAYVEAGGGLGIFVGPKTDVAHFNSELYQAGTGIFPLPLERTLTLPERVNPRSPDILTEDHPLFAPFRGTENSLLDLVHLETVMRPPAEWLAENQKDVRIAAWVRQRGELPLFVEKSLGKGRVMGVLTTAAPIWHNWNKNPTFVVALLELQDYLAARHADSNSILVGNPIRVTLDADKYRTPVRGVLTGEDGATREVVETPGVRNGSSLEIQLGTTPSMPNPVAERAGIYELWPVSDIGVTELRRYSANVDTAESDLAVVGLSALSAQYADALPSVINWNDLKADPHHSSATQLSKILLAVLIVLLFAEQMLAYALSYHPKRGGEQAAHAARGGAVV